MKLKTYIKNHNLINKKVVIIDKTLDENQSQVIWRDNIVIDLKNNRFKGLVSNEVISNNLNLLNNYGSRNVEIIDTDYEIIIIGLV